MSNINPCAGLDHPANRDGRPELGVMGQPDVRAGRPASVRLSLLLDS
jgi:hypothetical protein